MHPFTPDIMRTDRPVSSLGIDPSSELGARLLAARMRLCWLRRGFDVPVIVRLTVPPVKTGTKARREPCFGAHLVREATRRVNGDEALVLVRAIEDEVEAALTSRLNVRTDPMTKVAA